MKTRVGLMLRALIQVCITDDGTGSVHSVFLLIHQHGNGRRNDRALKGHETLPYSVTRRINSSLAYLRTYGRTTSAFTWWLNVRGMLPLLEGMKGLSRWAPTLGSQGHDDLLDFLLPIFYCLLILWWLHLWNQQVYYKMHEPKLKQRKHDEWKKGTYEFSKNGLIVRLPQ